MFVFVYMFKGDYMKVRKLILGTSKVIILMVLTIMFFALCIFGLYVAIDKIYHLNIDETHDSESYFSESYLKYNGGKEAKEFFDEYVYNGDYKDIAFHYKDGDKMISTLNYCTAFVLDIYYEDIPQNIIGSYASSSHYYIAPFSIYKIDRNDDIYDDNSAFIMFDGPHKTVRYVFICKYSSIRSDNVNESLNNVFFDLRWNYNKEDWIFDYSDIVIE